MQFITTESRHNRNQVRRKVSIRYAQNIYHKVLECCPVFQTQCWTYSFWNYWRCCYKPVHKMKKLGNMCFPFGKILPSVSGTDKISRIQYIQFSTQHKGRIQTRSVEASVVMWNRCKVLINIHYSLRHLL